jgi:Trk K+ transport system NAD-binding subunit/type III secretion system FlhB-like substrate exporter
MWRNSRALFGQFRRPLLAFLLTSLGGGFLYGELYQMAQRGSIPLIDRPYMMLQLMILETPHDIPTEWYLMLFWYTLPVIFIFIVGNGVADFVRLFFDRSGRQDAWRKALVSTYRNHIIVFGVGHVGLRVVRQLHEAGIQVVAIDHKLNTVTENALAEMKIATIRGDGTDPATLLDAGLKDAQAFVACTGSDQTNLLAIMQVRDMHKDIRIVARVWDEWYAQKMERLMNVESVLSASDLAAPAFVGRALGADITQKIDVDGLEYSTVRLIVTQGGYLDGRTVGEVQRHEDVDIVLLVRHKTSDIQPKHDVVIQSGDVVVIFARHERSLQMAALCSASA